MVLQDYRNCCPGTASLANNARLTLTLTVQVTAVFMQLTLPLLIHPVSKRLPQSAGGVVKGSSSTPEPSVDLREMALKRGSGSDRFGDG